MYLTTEEEKMLSGERGKVRERMLRLLVRLGDIYGADRMIPVESVQIAGVSFKSIGEAGLRFLEDCATKGAKVKVLTFLNPAGMDMEDWESLGIPEDFAKMQKRIITALREMGAIPLATCTPYLAGNLPRFGEHLAWAESSAVSFANSVIGARTNREGGPSALATAVCGVTPNYGLHLEENRKPDAVIKANVDLNSNADFGALGYWAGKRVKNKVPYFKGIKNANTDELKTLGAAMAASGTVAMYHIANLTPEACLRDTEELETIEVGEKELREAYNTLNSGKDPDLIALGCPHASLREVALLAGKLKGKSLRKPMWICTSKVTKEATKLTGFAETIERAGGKIVADTCMVVSPLEDIGYKTVATNSAKAANYLPGSCSGEAVFGDLDSLIEG